jgi:hypothetical protein
MLYSQPPIGSPLSAATHRAGAGSMGMQGLERNFTTLGRKNFRCATKLFQFVEQVNGSKFRSASKNQASQVVLAAASFDHHYAGRDRCGDASASLMS